MIRAGALRPLVPHNMRRMMREAMTRAVALGLMASVCVGLAQGVVWAKPLHATHYAALPGWRTETVSVVLPVLRAECRRIGQLPPETLLGGAVKLPAGRYAGDWGAACAALQNIAVTSPAVARHFVEAWFRPYTLTEQGEITGYFQPVFEASLQPGGAYRTPIYAHPSDLVSVPGTDGAPISGRWQDGRVVPYYDRAQIDHGALNGRGLEVAWLKSPVDRFFLQVQGSGVLVLPDGRRVAVGYDGRNGRPYVPLGREMVRDGLLASGTVSMESIRAWLEEHPVQASALMERNPNYVFFHLDGEASAVGPKGAFGVPLMPWRSVAVDRSVVPFGVPLWVQTTLPLANGTSEKWQHLVFAQDVGTDIRGVGRLDLFAGSGEQAAYVAGHLHEVGRVTVLLPRSAPGGAQ
nr:MltA domain-containing protein [uncultured Neokomagataea sp.]